MGGSLSDYFYDIIQTTDGGYAASGFKFSSIGDFGGGYGNALIAKFDNNGTVQWTRSIGGSYSDFKRILETGDGGYVAAGYKHDRESNAWVVKFNSNGEVQWEKSLGGSSSDYFNSIALADDGGYIAAGYTGSNDGDVSGGHGDVDGWVVKLDTNGAIVWQKSLGGSSGDVLYSIVPTRDGGCIAAGNTSSNDGDVSGNHGDSDGWVIKLDRHGDIKWQKVLGGSSVDVLMNITNTTDDGYMAVGYTYSSDGDAANTHNYSSDGWAVKLDANGEMSWQKTLGGTDSDMFLGVDQTKDGGYIISGSAHSNDGDISASHGDSDAWILKLRGDGAFEWQKLLGGSRYDNLSKIIQTNDSGLIAVGVTESNDGDVFGNHGALDAWAVRLGTPVAEVNLDKTSLQLNKGESGTLTATVGPEDATNKGVLWSSSDTSVATVDNKGVVTAAEKGTAVITVKTAEGDKIAQCTVNVTVNSVINKIRYGGVDRFGTAVEISKSGWTTSDNVILVNAYGFADALTGVPLAHVKGAPILLTDPDILTKVTNDEIIRLKAKKVYILGGSGVVSQSIENSLKGRGYNIQRIAGDGRFETAIDIGSNVLQSSTSKTAIITTAYNYPDALAISSYAAISRMPILYTDPVSFTESTRNFILQKGITKVIIPGGTGAVSLSIESELKNRGIDVQRIAGSDRYSTAYNIVNTFKTSFKNDAMLATGVNFPDALAGGALAAKMQIPIILVEQSSIDAEFTAFIRSKGSVNLYMLGGSGVISDNIINLINP